MIEILNKIIVTLIITILLFVCCPMIVVKSNAEETKTYKYETFDDYFKTRFDYDENIPKNEVTSIWINSLYEDEYFIKDISRNL